MNAVSHSQDGTQTQEGTQKGAVTVLRTRYIDTRHLRPHEHASAGHAEAEEERRMRHGMYEGVVFLLTLAAMVAPS